MRVILVSVGTDGDIFPYVGLGKTLRSRGHQVILVASAQYEPLACESGMAFRGLVSVEENHALFGHPDFWNPLKTAPLAARWGVQFLQRQYELISSLITEDAVLVSSPGVFAPALIHEKRGVPLANLILQPWMIPSSIAPPIMPCFTFLRGAPPPVWKGFWRALDVVVDVLVGPELNRFRKSLDLKPARRIFKNWLSPQLLLGLFPEWYGPPAVDWPAHLRLTGFARFDAGKNQNLPADLQQFCHSGSPPIAFTFGTGMAHSAKLFRAALEACGHLGMRGVFLTKYSDQLPLPLPPNIFHSAFAPFQTLFPQCAAVVNHGGIGTVVEALAAGTPQLIRPICFDQLDNGARVKRLGVGDCLSPKRADGKRMADSLSRLLTPAARSRCCEIAARLKDTGSLTTAAQHIEKLAQGHA